MHANIDKEKDILFLAKRLHKLMDANFTSMLASLDLTAQQGRMLLYVYAKTNIKNEIVKQKDIEEHFALSKSTVSELVTRMEKKELIKREQNQGTSSIVLTQKGFELIDIIEESRLENRKKCLNGISPDEVDNVIKALNKIIENIEEER